METRFTDICSAEDGSATLGRSPDGALFVKEEAGFVPYDFNKMYAGYYPACTFTALARAGGLFLLAGQDGEGAPHVFSSLLGGVWEERSLVARHPLLGERRAQGRITRILYDGEKGQVFLLCGRQLITLPDCPRCLRITDLAGEGEDAWLEGREVIIRLRGGGGQRIPLDKVAQYRISREYLAGLLAQGGLLVDLRALGESPAGLWEGACSVPMEEAPEWLEGQERGRPLVFFCRTGVNADQMARYARGRGFARVYSMGELDEIAGTL